MPNPWIPRSSATPRETARHPRVPTPAHNPFPANLAPHIPETIRITHLAILSQPFPDDPRLSVHSRRRS